MNKQLKYIKYYTFITIPAEGAILVMFHFTARFNNIYIHIFIFGHMQTQSEGLNFYFEIAMYTYINMLMYFPVTAWVSKGVSKIFTL